MDVVTRRTLNPNAPLFVPMAFRSVDDFSDQWWFLIHSSPWFREYWLQERFQDPQNDLDEEIVLPDLENFFEDFAFQQEEEEEDQFEFEFEFSKNLVPIRDSKWQKARTGAEAPRFAQKAPKIVNVKVRPRTIHQPR